MSGYSLLPLKNHLQSTSREGLLWFLLFLPAAFDEKFGSIGV
jgi:hypothetical protein